MPRLSVVVPTYNEAANVGALVAELRAALDGVDHEVVVVDDDSRDGTADLARAAGARVVVRRGEKGLATAVVRGIREAHGDWVVVMDADFQHPPPVVRRLYEKAVATDADLVVGSRYAEGGSEGGFGVGRRLISAGASAAAKVALPPVRRCRLTDPMSGLFLVRRSRVDLDALRPTGYKILLEIVARADLRRVEEVGYTFGDRRGGESKLGAAVIVQYLLHLAALAAWHPENRRMVRFVLVGLSGVGVNLGILWVLHGGFGVTDLIAVPVAVEASILSNFLLNDAFTFRDRRRGYAAARLVRFNLVSLVALGVNFATYVLLTRGLGLHYLLAEGIAIVIAFSANYLGNLNWTYGGADRFRLRTRLRALLPWAPFAVVVLAAAGLYLVELDRPRGMYFDEHYYVSVGHQIANGVWFDPCWGGDERPVNFEHPPLAKLLMAWSIHRFDTYPGVFEGCRDQSDNPEAQARYDAFEENLRTQGNPYAWRVPGALLGVAAVAFAGLAAHRLFGSPGAAALAAALVAADNLLFTSARIALLDIYATGFLMGAVYYATVPTRRGALLCALFLGLGFASKFTVLFAGPPVLLLAFWSHRRAGVLTRRRFDLLLAGIVLTPAVVWIASSMPWIWLWAQDHGWRWAAGHFVDVTQAALEWGRSGNAPHDYTSQPPEWFLQTRPVWYWASWDVEPGRHSFIYAVGNPLLWWFGALAALGAFLALAAHTLYRWSFPGGTPLTAWRAWDRSGQAVAVAALLPAFTYTAFFTVERQTFLFYMTILVPLLALPLAGALVFLWRRGGAPGRAAAVVLPLLVLAAFLHFFPVVAGVPITMERYEQILMDTVPWMDPCPPPPSATGAFTEVCPQPPPTPSTSAPAPT